MPASAMSCSIGSPGVGSPGCRGTTAEPMNGRLANRTAVVTGGSRGIGAAIVTAFAAEGADVIFCHDGDHNGAAKVLAAVTAMERRGASVECDVSDPDAVRTFFAGAESDFGRIDILVNNAGIGGEIPFEK